MSQSYDEIFSFAKARAREAGKKLLSLRGGAVNTKHKNNHHNIVTLADYVAERCIIEAIKKRFPDHGIISEEAGIVQPGAQRFWIIDPLDGTSNFAAGLDWFGVMIAFVENNEVKAGVAYLPVFDQMYYASKNQRTRKGKKLISVRSNLEIEDALCAVGIDAEGQEKQLKKQFEIIQKIAVSCRNIRTTNCLFDFCLLAEGKLGGAINFNMKIWDIAALSLIISKAGGIVTDFEGKPIDFTLSEDLIKREYPIVAGTPKTHQSLLEIIRRSRLEKSIQF